METRFAESGYSGPDRLVGFVSAASPFDPGKLTKCADRAWSAAGLERITLHECRYTFASLMIAAGVNAKALQSYMGQPTSRSPWIATAT